MKKFAIAIVLSLLAVSCKEPVPDPVDPVVPESSYELGADISWVTEMETRGYNFYNDAGHITECTNLMKELGCTAIRLRVWVNPADGWNGREDVYEKARRARMLGLKVMIDFHYSDWWADPGKQYMPEAWKKYSNDIDGMCDALAAHTRDVLQYLKDNGIDIDWVQVGNEVDNGMLWDLGRIDRDHTAFTRLINAGYTAAKSVYPETRVILHHANAYNLSDLTWFFDLVTEDKCNYDIIGLSLYPSYWDESQKAYPDWKPTTQMAVSNFKALHDKYAKPVMLVEFGMPASEPDKAEAALQYIIDRTVGYDWFGGVFLWEPESEHSRNGYDYGAFQDGRATSALNPFKNFKKQ